MFYSFGVICALVFCSSVRAQKTASDPCTYIVQPGDTLIKIANLLSDYLPLPYKQCMKCPGFKESCAYPEAQCPKCNHKGDYVALWKANGACKDGFMDADKIKAGKQLKIPNCGTPTAKPTAKPTTKPTSQAVKSAESDDAVDHFFKGVHKVAKTIVNAFKDTPTPAPSKSPKPVKAKPTKKPTPAPVKSDDYESTDVKTYYAAA